MAGWWTSVPPLCENVEFLLRTLSKHYSFFSLTQRYRVQGAAALSGANDGCQSSVSMPEFSRYLAGGKEASQAESCKSQTKTAKIKPLPTGMEDFPKSLGA